MPRTSIVFLLSMLNLHAIAIFSENVEWMIFRPGHGHRHADGPWIIDGYGHAGGQNEI